MISADYEFVICDNPTCIKSIKNHRWSKTKAKGWFFSRDDKEAFCQDHIPAWVKGWREQRTK